MTTTINRRTALLGTVTLPAALAPLGLAKAVSMPNATAAEPDSAVAAFHEWREAMLAVNTCGHDDDTPEGAPFWGRFDAAEEAIFDVVPTTPEGLACKARFVAEVCGDLQVGGDPANPADYGCHKWPNGEQLRFINSLLAYAERLAGRAV